MDNQKIIFLEVNMIIIGGQNNFLIAKKMFVDQKQILVIMLFFLVIFAPFNGWSYFFACELIVFNLHWHYGELSYI